MQELPGAKMVLLDSKGSEVHAWTTTAEPYGIFGLASGEYTLKELEAPEADSSADESPPETTAPDKELSELLALSGEEL